MERARSSRTSDLVKPTNVHTDPKFRMSNGPFSFHQERQLHVCFEELLPADAAADSNALLPATCLKGLGMTEGPAGGIFNSSGGSCLDFEGRGRR
mmetsp:Transcript_12930/g.27082  ORF Transcript_12930/g.27082 Transcript_12930/m.27082 type:complete len:95 (+) Transcript_12930:1252-1536(+)